MPFPILVDFALKNAGKYIAKNFGLKVLKSKGSIKTKNCLKNITIQTFLLIKKCQNGMKKT